MPVPLRRRLMAVCLVLFAAGGCDVIDDSSSPVDRVPLIDDMMKQIDRGREVSYLAEYQLAGGEKGTIGQQPERNRIAYGYPGGLIVIDEQGHTQCDTTLHPVKCQLRSLAPAAAGLPGSYTAATKHGLITAPVLTDLLRLTSLQLNAEVTPQDATVAGQQASCLRVRGLAEALTTGFDACVTADGVLASFTADVEGLHIDQALVRVGRKAGDETFALPDGAQIQDLRQS